MGAAEIFIQHHVAALLKSHGLSGEAANRDGASSLCSTDSHQAGRAAGLWSRLATGAGPEPASANTQRLGAFVGLPLERAAGLQQTEQAAPVLPLDYDLYYILTLRCKGGMSEL